MQSALVSWQYEESNSNSQLFASSANQHELITSPPLSPYSPPSLYNNNGESTIFTSEGGKDMVSTTTRAQIASSLLHQLQLQQLKDEQSGINNDFGLNWNEESINLSLFEELEEIEYTPPASPGCQLIQSQTLENTVVKMPVVATIPSSVEMDTTALAAEFQAILDSLPKEDNNGFLDSPVIQIGGILTTILEEEVGPVEIELDVALDLLAKEKIGFDEDDLMVMQIDQLEQEREQQNSPALSMSSMHFFNESDLASAISNPGSPASVVSNGVGMTIATVVDQHSEAAEKILDALILGDVMTAESFLPVMTSAEEESMDLVEDEEDNTVSSLGEVVANAKTGRRGRKPGSSNKLPRKDKVLRKKEQNKSAAVRYRQKKKMEFALVQDSEKELQDKKDDLVKQKDGLQREIAMVKQLLRDVIRAKSKQSKK